ncbi:DUF3604 domain-containing protein [Myxococcota bacterium]|nr:DUF3604 domain-containing protein [Myxococcota bacterium]
MGLTLALGACSVSDGKRSESFNPPAALPGHVACAGQDPSGQAFFGELHVHTKFSFDAYPFDVRVTPDQAYAFARGQPIRLPPLDAGGKGSRWLRIDRPLDFAAVTDHAEMFGEMRLCTERGTAQYASSACEIYRGERSVAGSESQPQLARVFAFLGVRREPSFCGEDLRACIHASGSVWREIQAAAERAYDRSEACSFTSFIGYEYSLTDDGNSIHRNVIFEDDVVPELPSSSVEAPQPHQLWEALHRDCLDAGTGCDAIVIPHNSNLSGGHVFHLDEPGISVAVAQQRADQRASLERLVEIMQVKGDSECRNGLFQVLGGPDEECDFEKVRPVGSPLVDCELGTGRNGFSADGCISRVNYVRYALLEGLRQRESLGVNALRLGIVAATDTHLGAPGAVSESDYPGSMGTSDHTPQLRLVDRERLEGAPARAFPLRNNPGGLAGIWAPENTRKALFEAMKRRETFGTSGPRIEPRFYAAWDLPLDLCEASNLLERSQAGGVPMGGTLEVEAQERRMPRFVFTAVADPASLSSGLERLQIVKGWIDDQGRMHQRVHDVAGSGAAYGPPDRCTDESPRGRSHLCAVWEDLDFDPGRPAVYYGRVLQVPTCRWSTFQCGALAGDDRPPACDDPSVPKHVRERAWTSPIWLEAAG